MSHKTGWNDGNPRAPRLNCFFINDRFGTSRDELRTRLPVLVLKADAHHQGAACNQAPTEGAAQGWAQVGRARFSRLTYSVIFSIASRVLAGLMVVTHSSKIVLACALMLTAACEGDGDSPTDIPNPSTEDTVDAGVDIPATGDPEPSQVPEQPTEPAPDAGVLPGGENPGRRRRYRRSGYPRTHPAPDSRLADLDAPATFSACPAEWWARFTASVFFDGLAPEHVTCAIQPLPLDWAAPDGQAIDVALIRVFGGTPEDITREMWLLDGGPGGTGLSYLSERIRQWFDPATTALYIPVLRGTILGTTLACDEEACVASLKATWGDAGLAGFRSINAAKDVLSFMRRVPTATAGGPGPERFVYGISYGTYWALEMMEHQTPDDVANDLLTGVILDGVIHQQVNFSQDVLVPEYAQDIQNHYAFCDTDPCAPAGFPGASPPPCPPLATIPHVTNRTSGKPSGIAHTVGIKGSSPDWPPSSGPPAVRPTIKPP